MARNLSAGVISAITASTVRPAVFYEGEFSTGILRLWSGVGSIDWNGQTWLGAGQMLSIAPIEEVSDVRAVGFAVSLAGDASALLSLNLGAARQGLPGTVWLGCFDPVAYMLLPGVVGACASTPDSPANSITSDLDVRCRVSLDDWTGATYQVFMCKGWRMNFAVTRSWAFYLEDLLNPGRLAFITSTTGTTAASSFISTVSPSVADGGILWIRVTWDQNDGGGLQVCKFWTSADGVVWTQLGATQTMATQAALFDGSQPLFVGNDAVQEFPISGKMYYAELRNGIDGPIVAKFDPLRFSSGSLSAEMPTGETWTLTQVSGSPAIVDTGYQIIADPYLSFRGRFDVPDILDEGERCTIQARYESRLIDLDRTRERRYTDEDQGIDFPGDPGFEFTTKLPDKTVTWGGGGINFENPFFRSQFPNNGDGGGGSGDV